MPVGRPGTRPGVRPLPPGAEKPAPPTTLPPVNTDKPSRPGRPEPRGGQDDGAPIGAVVPGDMFNVDGLLEQWGQSDSPYDLDGNGDVDGWDLALFLGGERPKTDEPAYNVQGLLDQWGQADSAYDLDGNGTVDGWDLAHFLGGQRPGDNSNAAPAATDPSSATNPDATAVAGADADTGAGAPQASEAVDDGQPPSDEQRFLNRFANLLFRMSGHGADQNIALADLNLGERLTNMLDKNGDGTIKRGDLLNAIQNELARTMETDESFDVRKYADDWLSRLGGPAQGETIMTQLGAKPAMTEEQRENALTRLASYMTNQFESAGFAKTPPRNLHEVVSHFNLTKTDRAFVMRQLASRYPDGLGVNRVG
jgi:hypothetical protein